MPPLHIGTLTNVVAFAEPKHVSEWPGLDGRLRLLVWLAGIIRFATYGRGVTVTSVSSGTHMAGSMHYVNRAVDLRSRDLPDVAAKESLLGFLKGAGAIVGATAILENLNGANEHYHVQIKP